MFKQFKTQQQNLVKQMLTGNVPVFTTDITGDEMWQAYLSAFPEAERQGHNCNCCRSFIKHYGNMVTIVDNKVQTIWNFATDVEEYQASIKALDILVSSKPINNVFIAEQSKVGTDFNFEQPVELGGSPIRWDHFSLVLPSYLVKHGVLSIDSIKGTHRDSRNVFKRSLDELTIDSTETILELISQNSLYRGEEYKAMLTAFLKVQRIYTTIKSEEKDNFVWAQAMISTNSFITKIRNTAIGTMLEEISSGTELDVAVGKFEKLMAPSNYKRPTAIFTKKMAQEAEAKLNELGLMPALARRFATTDDITVDNLLFVNREKKKDGLFETLASEQPINPKTLSKVETVTIEDFINNILPNSTSTEILLENKHEPNMVSLIAPVEKESASMFKWDNKFSWSYNNALADSMKERVKAAGGKVDGVLRFSIQWNEDGKSRMDFDAHAYTPGGHIYYASKWDTMNGQLDVDMISPIDTGIENITWADQSKMKYGVYKFAINNFNSGRNTGFSAEIEFNGEIYSFGSDKNTFGTVNLAEVTYSAAGFSIKTLVESTSAIQSKDMWNLKTNKFQKITSIMYSPNFWDGQQGIGNKHVFLMLDGAENTGLVRGFFNEYLKPDLDKHRKVFEALASKVTVQPTVNQLSGVGFSTTSKNEFYCKVTGKFTRTIKVTI